MSRDIERLVYIPSKLVLEYGKDEDEILTKVWETVSKQYNGNQLEVLSSKIHGGKKPQTCQEMVDCPECKGVIRYLTGFGALPSISNWLCAECNGTGKVKSGKPMPCPEHPYKGGS